jgi:hypothetical protein
MNWQKELIFSLKKNRERIFFLLIPSLYWFGFLLANHKADH